MLTMPIGTMAPMLADCTPGQPGEARLDARVGVQALRLVEAAEPAVHFRQHGVVGAIAEIDRDGAERHLQEQPRGDEQRQRQRHLRRHQRVARHESPAPRRRVVAGLHLQVGEDVGPRMLQRRPQRKSGGGQQAEDDGAGHDRGCGDAVEHDGDGDHPPGGST